ncbi:MAG: bifunctional oligoribonuclease/PAP phosphatase NrnA [Chloroflexota bacterium]
MTHRPPEWEKAIQAIKTAESILVVTHLRPDGDAMGSMLGLGKAFKQLGKDVTLAVDLGTPEFFSWMPDSDTILASLDRGTWDLMISTDASDEDRSGDVGAYGRSNSQTVINLDHHTTNTDFGDIHIIDDSAASASQIVFSLLEKMQIKWHHDLAQCLLTGLVTDTLGLRTKNTTPKELAIAQQLMTYGASLHDVSARTLGVMSVQELLVWQKIFPTIQIHGEIAEANIYRDDIVSAGMDYFDTGSIVGFLRKVTEVRIAVVYREDPDNMVKISLRSDPGYDVSAVAFELGGGGHPQASGADFNSTIAECRAVVMPLLQDALAKGSSERD